MAKTSFSEIVLNLFNEDEEITLNEMYHSLSTNKDIELRGSTLKHRIRSTLYGLKKSGKIKRVSDGTYIKL